MGDFLKRTKTADELINTLVSHFWSKLNNIVHLENGYETFVKQDIQESLRLRQSKTAKHIRFAPDFLIYNKTSKSDFLTEYKVTLTPRYSLNERQWQYGQVEADAFDNYLNLTAAGINVVIVIYCPYHPIPLLLGEPKKEWILGKRQTPSFSKGSGTDYYNIDLLKLRDFRIKISELLGLDSIDVMKLLSSDFYQALRNNPFLQIDHHKNSEYNKPKYKAGFNWKPGFLIKS
jgi:hypothetical protein